MVIVTTRKVTRMYKEGDVYKVSFDAVNEITLSENEATLLNSLTVLESNVYQLAYSLDTLQQKLKSKEDIEDVFVWIFTGVCLGIVAIGFLRRL